MAAKHVSLPSVFAGGNSTKWFRRFNICCTVNDWENETKPRNCLCYSKGQLRMSRRVSKLPRWRILSSAALTAPRGIQCHFAQSNAFGYTTLYAIFLVIQSSCHKGTAILFYKLCILSYNYYSSAFLFSGAFCMTSCTSIYTKSKIVMAVRIALITTTDISYITILTSWCCVKLKFAWAFGVCLHITQGL